jgi:hypothetical protein
LLLLLLFSFHLALLRLFLRAEEEELRGVLAVVRVGHGVGSLQLPVLTLKSLDQSEENEGAAELIAVVLAKVRVPVGGILEKLELRGLLVVANVGGSHVGEDLLELVDRLLAESRAHQLYNRGIEGHVDDEIRHCVLVFPPLLF